MVEQSAVARRSPASHLLVLGDDRWEKSARARVILGALYAATALVDAFITRLSGSFLVPASGAFLMMFGSFLAWRIARVSTNRSVRSWEAGTPHLGRMPVSERVMFVRWFVSLDDSLWNRQSVNASGTFEFLGVLAAGWGLYSFEDPRIAILAMGLAVTYLASASINVFTDASLFLPGLPTLGWLERTRRLIGPIGFLICFLIAVPAFDRFGQEDGAAPLANAWQWVAAVISAAMLGVGVRVRQHESAVTRAAQLAELRQQFGRKEIAQILHGEVTLRAKMLLVETQDRTEVPGDVRDAIRDLDGLIREMHYLENYVGRGTDWPGVLRAKADELLAKDGFRISFLIDEDQSISAQDRQVARAAFAEFSGNALVSGARTGECEISREGEMWSLTFSDDGTPINPSAWKRPNGGLERLELLLAAVGGELRITAVKSVTARWRASMVEPI